MKFPVNVHVIDASHHRWLRWKDELTDKLKAVNIDYRMTASQVSITDFDITYHFVRDSQALSGRQGYFYIRPGAYERSDIEELLQVLTLPNWKPAPGLLIFLP